MKSVSPATLELVSRLSRARCFWRQITRGTKEQVDLLGRIGCSGEAGVLPCIACLLVDASGPVRRAAAEAVEQLLQTLTPLELAELDEEMRAFASYHRTEDSRWRDLRPEDLTHLARTEHSLCLCGLASFHHNGYIREAAVKELDRFTDGSEVPFLLLRLNDWVVAVREAAWAAVAKRLTPPYARYFLQSVHLVLRLERSERTHRGSLDAVRELLRRAECREVLEAGMASGDRVVRRACCRLASEAQEPTRSSILKTALSDPDAATRAWAARLYLPGAPLEELPTVTAALLRDPFTPARREALMALATRLPELTKEHLLHALLDRHASIRDTARHLLGARTGLDPRCFYLNALRNNDPKTFVAAIHGLGETGEGGDVELVQHFLASPEARLRRAAIFALGRLAPARFVQEFTVALADQQPGVSREAARALRLEAHLADREALWALLRKDPRSFVRKNVLKVVECLGKWEKLAPPLWAYADADERNAEMSRSYVRQWLHRFNRSFAKPTEAQKRQIAEALGECSAKLQRHVSAHIRWCSEILRT